MEKILKKSKQKKERYAKGKEDESTKSIMSNLNWKSSEITGL